MNSAFRNSGWVDNCFTFDLSPLTWEHACQCELITCTSQVSHFQFFNWRINWTEASEQNSYAVAMLCYVSYVIVLTYYLYLFLQWRIWKIDRLKNADEVIIRWANLMTYQSANRSINSTHRSWVRRSAEVY